MAITWINRFIAQNTTGTSVLASGAINNSGYIYSVIVPAASGVPNSNQIAAGQNSASGALGAGFKNNQAVSASGVYVTLSGYGLTSETAYKMYLVGSGYTDGLMASGWALAFTTPDVTAPSWVAGYPKSSGTTINSTSIVLDLNDDGSGFFVIVPSGSAAPSATQIIAKTDADDVAISTGLYGSGTLVANTVKALTASNLSYGTYYTYYVTAKDDAYNATATVASGSFRTLVPPPGAPSNFYSAKNVADRRRRGLATYGLR